MPAKWPLGETYHELVRSGYYSTPEQWAYYLLFHKYDVPTQMEKGTANTPIPRFKLPWLPSVRFGDGRPGPQDHYPVAILGKMPYRDEVEHGTIGTGDSARLLRQLAHATGWGAIDYAYYCHLVRFFPPDGGKGALKPHWLKDTVPLLLWELSYVRPEFILLLGAEAVKFCFGKSATLDSVRGHVYVVPHLEALGTPLVRDADHCTPEEYVRGIKLFATIHPAQALKEVGYRKGLQRDLAEFRDLTTVRRAGNPDSTQGCTLMEVTLASDLKALVDRLLELSAARNGLDLAIDCEWGGTNGSDFTRGQLRSIQFAWSATEACTVTLRRQHLVEAQGPAERTLLMLELRRLIRAKGVRIVGHNIRADAKWLLMEDIPIMEQLAWDTMLADHALSENAEHGLEACALRYPTGLGRYDTALVKWFNDNKGEKKKVEREGYGMVPDAILLPYGALDVIATWRIKQHQAELFAKPENAAAWRCFSQTTLPCNHPILEIEMNGIFADYDRMDMLVWEFDRKKDELLYAVRKQIGNPSFNFRSTEQVRALLFAPKAAGGLGLTPLKTTGKPAVMWEDLERLHGHELNRYKPSTDGESLESIGDKHPVAGMLRDLKIIDQVTKSFMRLPEEDHMSGEYQYQDGLVGSIDFDGRIRTNISQMSETGRWKSSDPNCFSPDTEALTARGWVRFDALTRDDVLAQYDEKTGAISFAPPERWIVNQHKGELLHIFTEQQLDLLVTPDHDCLLRGRGGQHVRMKAAEYKEDYEQIQAGLYVGGGESYSAAQVSLLAALQADGSITKDGSYDFSFTKTRKYERLKDALETAGIRHRDYSNAKRYRLYVWHEDIPAWWRDRKFYGVWLLQWDLDSLRMLADEVWYWDGCLERRSMYASVYKENSDWVQIVQLLTGRRAKIRRYVSPKGSVSWQVDKSDRDGSGTTNRRIEAQPYEGLVYCVTMPKGTVVVRREGKVAITYQCQNLPKKQDKELERIMGKHIPKIRSCFMASPGKVIIEADFKSAEIFTMGYLANDALLVSDARTDLHARGAVLTMGAPKWPGFDDKAPPPSTWLEEHKAIRVAQKTVNFGIPYQRGAKAIAREIVKSTKGKVQCDTARAQGFIDGYYDTYRNVKAYVDMCKEAVMNPGFIFTPFGRTRRFASDVDEAMLAAQQRECVAMVIQGTVADLLNTAMINLYYWRQLNPGECDYDILLGVHDAVLLECPGECVETVYERVLPECMTLGARAPSWRPVDYWTPTQEFSLDIDREVMVRWGEKPKPEELRSRGVPDHFIEHHCAKKTS